MGPGKNPPKPPTNGAEGASHYVGKGQDPTGAFSGLPLSPVLSHSPGSAEPPGQTPASVLARWNTASSISSVTRPVNVFCWDGW